MTKYAALWRSINKRDHIRGDLIWFYAVGIGKENTQHLQYGWPLNTFSALISKCHDENVSAVSDSVFTCYSIEDFSGLNDPSPHGYLLDS